MILRVAVVAEHLGAMLSPCGSIRLSAFFDRIRMLDGRWQVRYLIPEEVTAFRPDVIVWQRTAMDESQVAVVASLAEQLGALMIYDIDDNLFDLDDEAERRAYASKLKGVEKSLNVANQVWCSTNELAERVGGMTLRAPRVMTNALDPDLWGQPPMLMVNGNVHRLMYMGTRTHAADLGLLSQAMDLLEARYPGRFKLDVVGVANEYPDRSWMAPLPIPTYVGASYPAFVHWLRQQAPRRLGVAPLLSSPFNDCKSSIKVMDYAALGMPTLASDVPAYGAMQTNVECFKVANDPGLWAVAIARACDDTELSARILAGAAARIGSFRFEEAVRVRMDAILEGRLC